MAEKATAEKPPAKKKPARQQMLEAVAQTEEAVTERRQAQASPEEKVQAKAAAEAVAVAEELSTKGVVQSIGELKASVGRMLGDLSDRLDGLVERYTQVQRAIAARDKELKEIYEIQRNASTLTALIETHDRLRREWETELASSRQNLQDEIDQTRERWEAEKKQGEAEVKERDAAEQKRRDREKEEYRYATAREQQQARDAFNDEMGKAAKALSERKAQADKDHQDRERALKAREDEVAALRRQAETFPAQLEAGIAKAVKDTTARLQQEAAGHAELLKREFGGEKNVLTTRIAALERTTQDQAEQIAKLVQQAEKAYGQVQEIAVRAIEGSASTKQLASLQQLLAEQARKGGGER